MALAGALAFAVRPAAALASEDPLGASALDALAVLGDAEARTHRLAADGVRTFSCRITSPYVEKLWEIGGPLEGRPLTFTLWWRAPGLARVTAGGDEGAPPEIVARAATFFSAVPQAFLAPSASERLAGRVLSLHAGPAGETVVEAGARDARERSRYTVNADGLVSREEATHADGTASDLVFEHARAAGRTVVARSHGTWRGEPVDLSLEWGALASGRPVPTRIVARRFDAATGRALPGALGETVFVLSDHVVNGDVPPWVFAESLGDIEP